MSKLKRALGLFETSVYGIGLILGAGIYALIGEAAGVGGNTLWASFVLAAIIAAFTALSYCELSSIFPKVAAEYVYTYKAFNKRSFSFVVGWMFLFTLIFSTATVALGFGGYFSSLVSGFVSLPVFIGAAILVVLMTLINIYGIEQSSKINVVLTAAEIFGLIFIIVIGVSYFGSVDYTVMPSTGFKGIFVGAALVFFAYIGFEDIVNVSEEAKEPRKTIPKAIIISIIVTTIIYILVSISAVSIVPWQELGQTKAPLSAVAESVIPGTSPLLSTIALFSTGNTVLILLIVLTRVIFGMARYGVLPGPLSRVSKESKTPWIAGLMGMTLVLFFLLIEDIRGVAEIANFGILSVFVIVNCSLIYLRFSKPYKRRAFKVPLNIGKFPILPLLGIIFSLFLISQFKLFTIGLGVGVFLLGFIVYKLVEFLEASR